MTSVRLTQLVQGGGCARKLPAADLVEVLKRVPATNHAWVDAATAPLDDAALVQPPGAERELVLTVDIITAVVDDPGDFARIAAANALSDVYAMGGRPEVALSFAGLPEELGLEVIEQVLGGMADKAREAGTAIVGGHTIRDTEPKCGLAVIGSVEPGRAWTQRKAQAGQAVVLSKPLGAGVITQALRKQSAEPAWVEAVTRSMQTLNRAACEAGRAHGVTAATDVTGFGLLGHLYQLAEASGLAAVIRARSVPLFDGALEAVRGGFVPGGTRRNLTYVAPHLHGTDAFEAELVTLLADAQTSGGLLLCAPAEQAEALARAIGPGAAVIGELASGEPGVVRLA
jgi:selenide, water dikinase